MEGVRSFCRSLAAIAIPLAVAGCQDDSAAAGGGGSGGASTGPGGLYCKIPFLGDPDKPIEMQLIALGDGAVSSELTDGGPAPMILPPQGGRVILAGVRVTNFDPCGAVILGALRDPTTQQVRVDERTTNFQPSADGWGGSVDADMSTFSNIPTCPNEWASTDLYGNSFELTVTVTDRAGRTATQSLDVVPFCAEADNEAECLCKCKQGYVLGEACPPSG